jgi:hypothetical protein
MAKPTVTDEDLLSEIEANASGGVGEPKNRRVLALERLQKRRLMNPSRGVRVLCELIRLVGPQPSDFHLVTTCLARMTSSDTGALVRLIGLIGEHHSGAVRCGCQLLPSLKREPQARLAGALAKKLLGADTEHDLAETLIASLRELTGREAKAAVTEELARCLDSPVFTIIRRAVGVLSRVADKHVERSFVKVLRKMLQGYYLGTPQAFRDDLCAYLARTGGKAAARALLRAMETQHEECFAKAVGAICGRHPEVQGDLLRLFRTARRKESADAVRLSCLRAFSAVQKHRPPVAELAKAVTDHDLGYESFRSELRELLLRIPRQSRRIVLGMIQSGDEVRYRFAMDVLKGMQVPMSEVARALGTNPVVATYAYFFGHAADGLGIRPLSEVKAEKLRENLKGKTTKFEHFIRHLLSCLGFITLDVDPSGKSGVDTVAFPPGWSHMLVISTTTGVVGDSLEKLANTTKGLRATLGKLADKIDVVPLVITSLASETNPKDEQYARHQGILVLRAPDVDRLVEWVSTNRSYKEVLASLDQRAEKRPPRTVLEALERLPRSARV